MSISKKLFAFSKQVLGARFPGNREQRRAQSRRREMSLEPLEPRMLLSGDVAIFAPQITEIAMPAATQAASEIIFVDQTVSDYASLIAREDVQAEVILLDGAKDGVAQMTDVLADRTGVSAVHVVSHGIAGRVTLGTSVLDSTSVDNYAEALRTWGEALTADGDILFYGCDIGQGEMGAALLNRISMLTDADVAASVDVTGNPALGGDWILEYQTGRIDTAVGLSTEGYQFILAPTLSGISAIADSGTPKDDLVPSANVRQPVLLTGSGFALSSQVVFPTINYAGTIGSQTVAPVQAAADGTSMTVIVPDTAMTGNLSVVGGSGSIRLQIVPTIVDVDLTGGSFTPGAGFQILGSGFTEGNAIVRFGTTEVVDTSVSAGPDVSYYNNIGGGLDRADNEVIYLTVPTGASPGPITVETAGGTSAALPISLSQVHGLALSGTSANPSQPSANPGQTIRITGTRLD
ncbi:MAG: DUF4347 domain-containing protein, partial [Gallionella sp.]|nr:DUF4347 domain-containing protein [Gallionella sp.]